MTPTQRSDRRLSTSYAWTRPRGAHVMRMGGEISQDWSDSQTDANARGNFVFTGALRGGRRQ